jgi:hypothetical protein
MTKEILNTDFDKLVDRMIKISKEKPLLPELFVPWDDQPNEHTHFMPEHMVSLQGHELWNQLSSKQKIELGKLEMVQVMYSYAWSETLACHFFNRHLLTLNPNTTEAKFLIRELIEEYRHQEMFAMAIEKLDGKPILPTGLHKFFGNVTVKYLPPPLVFMSVLAIEMMADIYAKHIRKDEKVFSILRKTSELHHIEEGRHIFYTEAWLKKYTENAGTFKKSIYSIIIMLNIYYMRTLYVKRDFFKTIGLSNADQCYKAALLNYKHKFAKFALPEAIEYVNSFGGFNRVTKYLWKKVLYVTVQ